MNFSEVFIRRPIATSLLMAALALVGIVAFPLLPVAPLPQVDFPTIQVLATVPGASPETMAATVATPLERQFGQIAGVAQMSSVSSLGSTVVTLQFDLNRNIDGAAQDVQAAITAAGAQLPKNLSDAADLPQGQSGGFPNAHYCGEFGHDPAHQSRRFRRECRRSADFTDCRRRPSDHRRSAAARYSRAGRPRQVDRTPADARGCA